MSESTRFPESHILERGRARHDSANPALLLNVRNAAGALAISERNLWERTKTGEIPSVRIGRSVRYSVRDLEAWIEMQKKGGQPQ